ncbi:MAG TPA: toll/interleukin-1 receptor domain-containing protein [Flavisolibacter sp.]|nr:toll/interleukin-1 receptor domain-containing protein [Flavisolibacter sp.]
MLAEKYDIFLSHNSVDKAWTERLATAIEADESGATMPRLRTFFDKWDVLPSADVPRELEEALQASRYVGLVLSPEALASDWVSLERSTALYRDPRAQSRFLIPLLVRDCEIPAMLARIKFIDFRREPDFENSLSELINVLRGRPISRGISTEAISDAYFREDASLLGQHRKVFQRRAFITPCFLEVSADELEEAIDDTIAALNTGTLYSRNGKLLLTFPAISSYKLPLFKNTFKEIMNLLDDLRRLVRDLHEKFRNKKYPHTYFKEGGMGRDNFLRILDLVDEGRNKILFTLNTILEVSQLDPFDLIPHSSKLNNLKVTEQEVALLWGFPQSFLDKNNPNKP